MPTGESPAKGSFWTRELLCGLPAPCWSGCLVGVLVWVMGVGSFERVELKRASFSCRGSFN